MASRLATQSTQDRRANPMIRSGDEHDFAYESRIKHAAIRHQSSEEQQLADITEEFLKRGLAAIMAALQPLKGRKGVGEIKLCEWASTIKPSKGTTAPSIWREKHSFMQRGWSQREILQAGDMLKKQLSERDLATGPRGRIELS